MLSARSDCLSVNCPVRTGRTILQQIDLRASRSGERRSAAASEPQLSSAAFQLPAQLNRANCKYDYDYDFARALSVSAGATHLSRSTENDSGGICAHLYPRGAHPSPLAATISPKVDPNRFGFAPERTMFQRAGMTSRPTPAPSRSSEGQCADEMVTAPQLDAGHAARSVTCVSRAARLPLPSFDRQSSRQREVHLLKQSGGRPASRCLYPHRRERKKSAR